MGELWIPAVCVWVGSGIVGGIIGAGRNSGAAGFFLGLLFGPLGALAAFALDGRQLCPKCLNKIANHVRICPTCHAELGWVNGYVGLRQQIEDRLARLAMNHAADERYAREKHEEEARRRAESRVRRAALFAAIIQALARPFRFAGRMMSKADRTLLSIADGSQALYRTMQIGWFVLLPLLVLGGTVLVIRVELSRHRNLGDSQEEAERPSVRLLQPDKPPPE